MKSYPATRKLVTLINKVMVDQGKSPQDIHEVTGIAPSTLADILNGRRKFIQVTTVEKLATALGVHPAEMQAVAKPSRGKKYRDADARTRVVNLPRTPVEDTEPEASVTQPEVPDPSPNLNGTKLVYKVSVPRRAALLTKDNRDILHQRLTSSLIDLIDQMLDEQAK